MSRHTPVPNAPVPNAKELLAALRERHGVDRATVAAMVFERSRWQQVSPAKAFTDLAAELDHLASSAAPRAPRVFRNAKDVADAVIEYRRRHLERG